MLLPRPRPPSPAAPHAWPAPTGPPSAGHRSCARGARRRGGGPIGPGDRLGIRPGGGGPMRGRGGAGGGAPRGVASLAPGAAPRWVIQDRFGAALRVELEDLDGAPNFREMAPAPGPGRPGRA